MKLRHIGWLLFTSTILCGCMLGYKAYTPADAENSAVLELDLRYLQSAKHGELFRCFTIDDAIVDGDDGRQKFSNRRILRDEKGKLEKAFILMPQGSYNLTFGYNRYKIVPTGRALWACSTTQVVQLEKGIYRVKGEVRGDWVTYWLEDAKGSRVAGPYTQTPEYFPPEIDYDTSIAIGLGALGPVFKK